MSSNAPFIYFDINVLRDARRDSQLRARIRCALDDCGLPVAVSPVLLWELMCGEFENWHHELRSLFDLGAPLVFLEDPISLASRSLDAAIRGDGPPGLSWNPVDLKNLGTSYPDGTQLDWYKQWRFLSTVQITTARLSPQGYRRQARVPESEPGAAARAAEAAAELPAGAVADAITAVLSPMASATISPEIAEFVEDIAAKAKQMSAQGQHRRERPELFKWGVEQAHYSPRISDIVLLTGSLLTERLHVDPGAARCWLEAPETDIPLLTNTPREQLRNVDVDSTIIGPVLACREERWKKVTGGRALPEAKIQELFSDLLSGLASDPRRKPRPSDFADDLHLLYLPFSAAMTSDGDAADTYGKANKTGFGSAFIDRLYPRARLDELLAMMAGPGTTTD